MSIDLSGMDKPVSSSIVKIAILEDHPLIKLANLLPWAELIDSIVPDIKKSTVKGFWWSGRKICLRLHLAVFFLQKIYDLTDRGTEYGLKDNAAYQLFSGIGIVDGWHAPHHSQITIFRNRLSPETQRSLTNQMAKIAVSLGFADPSETDLDSTVQEAGIAYPSDATLMTKLCKMGKKVVDFVREKMPNLIPKDISIDMTSVKKKAREYFFMAKNTSIDKRRQCFADFHRLVKGQMRSLISICETSDPMIQSQLPWNIRRAFQTIREDGRRYLLDVAHFIRRHTIKSGKRLSFYAKQVACIKKGKAGKEHEFGRVFQLGRIKGNFLFVLAANGVRMADKLSFIPLVEEHGRIFGEDMLQSIAADKGYWSRKNQDELIRRDVKEIGLQHPANIKNTKLVQDEEVKQRTRDRRAGIEALIGNVKHGGQLRKSRMKGDTATLAAGYSSILGFNLRQMARYSIGKAKKAS